MSARANDVIEWIARVEREVEVWDHLRRRAPRYTLAEHFRSTLRRDRVNQTVGLYVLRHGYRDGMWGGP